MDCEHCDRIACLLQDPRPCELLVRQEEIEMDMFLLESEAGRLKKLPDYSSIKREVEKWEKSLERYRIKISPKLYEGHLEGLYFHLEKVFPEDKSLGGMFYHFNPQRRQLHGFGGGHIVLSDGSIAHRSIPCTQAQWDDFRKGIVNNSFLSDYLKGKVVEVIYSEEEVIK